MDRLLHQCTGRWYSYKLMDLTHLSEKWSVFSFKMPIIFGYSWVCCTTAYLIIPQLWPDYSWLPINITKARIAIFTIMDLLEKKKALRVPTGLVEIIFITYFTGDNPESQMGHLHSNASWVIGHSLYPVFPYSPTVAIEVKEFSFA